MRPAFKSRIDDAEQFLAQVAADISEEVRSSSVFVREDLAEGVDHAGSIRLEFLENSGRRRFKINAGADEAIAPGIGDVDRYFLDREFRDRLVSLWRRLPRRFVPFFRSARVPVLVLLRRLLPERRWLSLRPQAPGWRRRLACNRLGEDKVGEGKTDAAENCRHDQRRD